MTRFKASDIERFWANTAAGEGGCTVWTARISSRGYGRFMGIGAHRWILGHLLGRPLDADEFALHRCDRPVCVNPEHLYVGSHADNMRDMVSRGRGSNDLARSNASKTHCPLGHEYTPENTRRNGRGSRDCRACRTNKRGDIAA